MQKKLFSAIFIIFLLVLAPSSLAQNQATEEANSIREKVREKLDKARNLPKAYLGTVTDITEDTIQINNRQDEIQQISVDIEETTFIKIAKTTTKIKLEDIGIGDFVVAMGFENGNKILEAKRILSTAPIKSSTRKAVLGKIKNIKNKTVILSTTEQNEVTLSFPRRWKGPEISELDEGVSVIAVGEFKDNEITVRTIKIVSSPKPSPVSEDIEN
jgi:hypothetical protein